MKTYFFIIILLITFSCQKDIASSPSDYLSKDEIVNFKINIVRYFEGLPKNVDHNKKWDTIYNDYYNQKAAASDLLHYYKNDDGFIYFAVAKIAPSMILKKNATIGKLKMENDSIVYYEEIARTWKMEVPELKEKTKILFDKIVNGKDVSEYYTKNSDPEFWIEFPDDQTFYNTKERKWETKN
jgi:hypothetical protein